jgi:hypothetical protein
MKPFVIIHILLFILLMIVYQLAKGQDYVVNTKGDTLYGQVKPVTFGSEKKVQVSSADKKKTLLPIFHVRAFTYKGETFHPVKTSTGYSFMKLVKPGYLSLYKYQLENQVNYDGQYLTKRDGTGIEVPNLSFKKLMAKYLSDCADVSERIDNGELNKKDLTQIVDEYNACIEQRTVNHEKVNTVAVKKLESWDVLEKSVTEKPDFEGKSDALEMITEIKAKVNRNEKVPNFLIEGLKNVLAKANLSAQLDSALRDSN